MKKSHNPNDNINPSYPAGSLQSQQDGKILNLFSALWSYYLRADVTALACCEWKKGHKTLGSREAEN